MTLPFWGLQVVESPYIQRGQLLHMGNQIVAPTNLTGWHTLYFWRVQSCISIRWEPNHAD